MGFKLRAGMAMGGMLLSYFFGLSFLSGIASHLDTTGNILVDIADGIGIVSKGIEALESYLDPSSTPAPEELPETTATPAPVVSCPVVASVETTTPAPDTPKPVVCNKRGKCAPYDPLKDRFLQQQLIHAERLRILQQFQAGTLPTDSLVSSAKMFDDETDDDDFDHTAALKLRQAAAAQQLKERNKGLKFTEPSRGQPVVPETKISPDPNPVEANLNTNKKETQIKPNNPVILDPVNPQIDVDPTKPELPPWKFGAKKILSSVNGVCQRLNNLILKFVAKIFPWNRRAKRRLAPKDGTADDEE